MHSSGKISAEIFDAASAPVRMQILKLLASSGLLAYTEIMSSIKLDPIRDAGKFVYHLKSIVEPGLVDMDRETKKYGITELGKLVVNFSRDIEEYIAIKKGKLYVRTSRFSIEEFDRDKITHSLVSEADVPHELAQELAVEVEERLLKSRTRYLTAPLIRELINSILIEKKLEDYRHKLTRLGMPVYDVTQLIKNASDRLLDVNTVQESAGSSVLEEYVLLNGIPRSVADSHISGEVHIEFLSDWILKPEEFQHDPRFFIKRKSGISNPPRSIGSCLSIIEKVCNLCSSEISNEQAFDMFNIFLAPFVKGVKKERLTEIFIDFINRLNRWPVSNVSKHPLSLGIEATIPSYLQGIEAIGVDGKIIGTYGEFIRETRVIAETIVEAITKIASNTPILNPRLIFKIRGKMMDDSEIQPLISSVHNLAAKYGLPNFTVVNEDEEVTCTSSGLKFDNEWKGDWQTTCFRTGNLGTIFLNLPRIAYDAQRDDDIVFESIHNVIQKTVEAFNSKRLAINERMKQGLLPLLSYMHEGSTYFYQDNASYAISYVGLNEAVRFHTEKELHKDESAIKFASNILSMIVKETKTLSEELEMRIRVAQRPGDYAATRLAELDIEKFGRATTVIEGTRTHPYYTDLTTLSLSTKISLQNRAKIESKFQAMTRGGHLLPIQLVSKEHNSRTIHGLTNVLLSENVRSFAYSNNFSYCRTCRNYTVGITSKCPKCDSASLSHIGRCSATYETLSLWPDAKRRTIEKRTSYPSST